MCMSRLFFPDPSSPDNILLKSRTNASLQFEWSLPQYSNGVIKLYISYFQYVGPAYFVPSRCSFTSTEAIPRETASLQQTFQSLLAYSSYSIQVAAQNEYGVGYFSRPLVVQTAPWSRSLIFIQMFCSEYSIKVINSFRCC